MANIFQIFKRHWAKLNARFPFLNPNILPLAVFILILNASIQSGIFPRNKDQTEFFRHCTHENKVQTKILTTLSATIGPEKLFNRGRAVLLLDESSLQVRWGDARLNLQTLALRFIHQRHSWSYFGLQWRLIEVSGMRPEREVITFFAILLCGRRCSF